MTEKFMYHIEPTQKQDIPTVVTMLGSESAVVPLTEQQVVERIDQGLSLVAKDNEGNIIGHQGAMIWPQSGIPEIGSAVVVSSCRGKGVSTAIKKHFIPQIQAKHPGKPIMAFTERTSQSRGILQKLGFEKQPMAEVPTECFDICPASEEDCYGKTKQDPPACGCVVFVLKPEKGEIVDEK